ncbi:uncharacterized protein CCOS01_07391 [Colletotrichum costaricense]|uniref:Uncharacterized protein n=2 Tax=Colletotrichum acutatum species complex TaxID=2707335 RepID=A0AAJ0E057_9PEZI|nr:uncharacterized protein CCOS01_07391 [Colletotrichum costaricense]XP_060381920.1 uncharacterized protein CTAM01_07522 [Colletotrichum tamarilloi]KAK1498304.1 hypothetical protein CTAM01_07522 [Colletotrichum tamarilloi]KAK1527129.1 hypothetical protein CCOS01_07391 [Colletotrichum costaricense]
MPSPYKTALITGATSGTSYALAERLVANGGFFIAAGRRADRLEKILSKHGSSKVATEVYDVSNIDGMESWIEEVTTKYPKLDCLFLNAGDQNTFDFTPALLETAKNELNLNYFSPLVATSHILPHFEFLSTPTAVKLVTSSLAIVPMSRCADYCASKAALRSLTWSLRAQLADRGPHTESIRVIEIVPPAVKTELHTRQADLVAAGRAGVGMPLEQFIDET